MRILLTLLALLIASPAFAISDRVVDFCQTMKEPMQCIKDFIAEERQARREAAEAQRSAAEAQLEAAQAQERGMALFGSGLGMMTGSTKALTTCAFNLPLFHFNQCRRHFRMLADAKTVAFCEAKNYSSLCHKLWGRDPVRGRRQKIQPRSTD